MGSSRKTRTRVLGIAAAAALALGATACGSSSTSAGGGANAGGSFTYWSMWQADEPQAQVLKAAIADFTAQTGIKVNVTWAGRDVSMKIGPAIAANQEPDLWDQANDVVYGATASSGQALDLSPVLAMPVPGEGKTVADVIPAKYFSMMPKDPNGSDHYLIPYEIGTTAIFYNAADPALKAVMPKPPTTWAGFIAVCDALKARGKACIAQDGDDFYSADAYFDYLLNAGGVNVNTLANDKTGAAWDDPAVLTAATQVEQLVKGGYILPGYDATKFPAQEINWASGKAAFYMDGSWVTSEVSKEIPATWKFGSFVLPGAQTPDAALFGFSIPAKAKNASAAERFIAFFMQKKEMSGMASTALNITPRTDIPAPSQLADAQKELSSPTVRMYIDAAPGTWKTKVLKPDYLDFWHGNETAAQFIAQVKADQIAYWKTQD